MVNPSRRFVVGTPRLHRVHSRILVGLVVTFQGGCRLEKANAPKHHPFHWRHNRSVVDCLGVDAERNSAGVRQDKPRCEPDQPGKYFSVITLNR